MGYEYVEEPVVGAKIKVIGVGGGGGNALNCIAQAGIEGNVEYIAVNTDIQALHKSAAHTQIQIGEKLTHGLGAGAKPEIGEASAQESKDEIENAIKDADMVFITAGMGGGTGTGAAPVVAEIAQSLDKLTIAVVTKPFKFEGAKKMERAEKGIEALIKHVDALIVIPNQNLITNEMRLTMKQSYAIADEVLKTEASVQNVKKPETLKEHKGVLEFSHVDFKYPGAEHNVLSDIDFKEHTINIDHQLQKKSKIGYYIQETKTTSGTRKIPMTADVEECFRKIVEKRNPPKAEPMVNGKAGFLYFDKNGSICYSLHWEHYFKHIVQKYNNIYKVQMPNITPHVCRHTYCSNMAKSGMNPKTLQYLMGHSDISVTLNTYTHVNLEDAREEVARLRIV